jgi:hypothetical protein
VNDACGRAHCSARMYNSVYDSMQAQSLCLLNSSHVVCAKLLVRLRKAHAVAFTLLEMTQQSDHYTMQCSWYWCILCICTGSSSGQLTVDLHGLHVTEALDVVKSLVAQAQLRQVSPPLLLFNLLLAAVCACIARVTVHTCDVMTHCIALQRLQGQQLFSAC